MASLGLNFLAMFIVIPYLTSDPVTYGVYSVCISFSIFLSYADLGFIGAGQKFAAEYYAKRDIIQEVRVIGFTNFILLCFLLIISVCFAFLSIYPELLISGIGSSDEKEIASSLFSILAFFTPFSFFLQRILQMIFSIRLEDYLIQRANVFGNVLKIISVFFFFKDKEYDIVGYFFFGQMINLLVSLTMISIAYKRYNYDFVLLLNSIRFNRQLFVKIQSLAVAGLFATFSWILFYELDSVVISRFLGVELLGYYAVGLSILALFRSVFGVLFSPFNIRFNYFIGNDDEMSLKSFYLKIIRLLAPIVVLPIIVFACFTESFVLSWVGTKYIASIDVVLFLVLCNIFAFITYPTNFMLFAKERQKELNKMNFLLPVFYWLGILFSVNYLGINAFAIFKLATFIVSFIILSKFMLQYLQLELNFFVKAIFLPMLMPIFFIISSSFFIQQVIIVHKSALNFLIVIISITIVSLISFVIQFAVSKYWRNSVLEIFKSVKCLNKS